MRWEGESENRFDVSEEGCTDDSATKTQRMKCKTLHLFEIFFRVAVYNCKLRSKIALLQSHLKHAHEDYNTLFSLLKKRMRHKIEKRVID